MKPDRRAFQYGHCHALSASLVQFAPAGEVVGLYTEGDCIHSAFRVPHSDVYVDAFGAELGTEGLRLKASRYVRPGSSFEWRVINDVRPLVSGNRSAAIRKASRFARELLAVADQVKLMEPTCRG